MLNLSNRFAYLSSVCEECELSSYACSQFTETVIFPPVTHNDGIQVTGTHRNISFSETLGFLRRNLYACPQEVKEAAYKGLVRPVLEYSSSVCDPSGVGLQNDLEKVQNLAARFVTGNYNFETGSMNGILEHLKWKSLKKRRRDSRLILLYKGLKGKASIPTDDLIPLVRCCRNDHSMAYQVPIANTNIYKCSIFPQTIRDWNALPDSLVSSAEGAEDGVAKFTSPVKARD